MHSIPLILDNRASGKGKSLCCYMKEKLQPYIPNDKRVTQKGAGSRTDCTTSEHPLLHNGTPGGKKILKKRTPEPKLEQFSLGLEEEILTQTPLPQALPIPSIPWPCAMSGSDPALLCPSHSIHTA
ncbi:hypothetical protein WISP_104699 [Willisornis vidua]|uniref:Uncharacterized protein n=1 Tax=Willisornis vidua TaxID=1566151 RepID=A0ABQ9CX95_9PASS|nr:hypothetical protein WISP_104699 [Willisornis vidua]